MFDRGGIKSIMERLLSCTVVLGGYNLLLSGEKEIDLCKWFVEEFKGLLNLSSLLFVPLLLLLLIKYSFIALSSLSAALSITIVGCSF